MRKSVSLLALGLMLGSVACEATTGDDEDDVVGTVREGGDAGDRPTPVAPGSSDAGRDAQTASTPDASTQVSDASTVPVDAAAPLPARPEQCVSVLPTASVACGADDVLEPNDKQTSAAQVATDTGCALVQGKLASNLDEDWYLFTSPKADPVRIELAYETTPTGDADLDFLLWDFTSSNYLLYESGREDLKWTLSGAHVLKKNLGYTVQVRDGSLTGCQGYNLRIDTQFCTDAFEDNDAREAAAKGLGYGTPLVATAFSGDEDWYDLSAFQATGASCVITADIALTSAQTVDALSYGAGNSNYVDYETVTGNQPSMTITVKPGAGTLLLLVRSAREECTTYTVLCSRL